ncbi:MAG: hypothetical protein KDK62_02085, partial [Chlamydiia bacterium]|nr:hypothetical protein [Chlamydiia bacterium]
AISEKMRKRFLKEETLKQILSVYEQEGSRLHLSGAPLTRLRHTPWITRIGNNPSALMRTYTNLSKEDISETFNPTSVENLLESVVASAKKELDRVSDTRRGHLSTHIPMRIVGEHAFNLILTHPSFMRCVVGDVKEILQEMEAKCHRIPETPLPHETRENMEAYILSRAAHLKAFLEETPPDSTLASYRVYLTQKLSHETIDRKLFQFLPEEIQKELEELAIHFADTNWQINGSDIHLAIVYNPFTLKLELFHAEGSGKLLYPVNMKEQLAGKTWEIFFNSQAAV